MWDSSYVGVWHLSESSGNAQDSTYYETDGSPLGGVTQGSTGQISGAYDFDGTSPYDRVEMGDPVDEHLDFDDLDDFRPGMKAAEEFGIRSPLKEAMLTKEDIRSLSQGMDLLTWDKPSFACLASQFPYGMKITRGNLVKVNKAERFLKSLGITQIRVRHHDKMARIEVMEEDIPKLLEERLRRQVISYFKELGYSYVSVDLEGYRTGSMNEVLNADERR